MPLQQQPVVVNNTIMACIWFDAEALAMIYTKRNITGKFDTAAARWQNGTDG